MCELFSTDILSPITSDTVLVLYHIYTFFIFSLQPASVQRFFYNVYHAMHSLGLLSFSHAESASSKSEDRLSRKRRNLTISRRSLFGNPINSVVNLSMFRCICSRFLFCLGINIAVKRLAKEPTGPDRPARV